VITNPFLVASLQWGRQPERQPPDLARRRAHGAESAHVPADHRTGRHWEHPLAVARLLHHVAPADRVQPRAGRVPHGALLDRWEEREGTDLYCLWPGLVEQRRLGLVRMARFCSFLWSFLVCLRLIGFAHGRVRKVLPDFSSEGRLKER
jgi:hypothetical protein